MRILPALETMTTPCHVLACYLGHRERGHQLASPANSTMVAGRSAETLAISPPKPSKQSMRRCWSCTRRCAGVGERVPVIWLPDAQRPDRQGVGAVAAMASPNAEPWTLSTES